MAILLCTGSCKNRHWSKLKVLVGLNEDFVLNALLFFMLMNYMKTALGAVFLHTMLCCQQIVLSMESDREHDKVEKPTGF